ncbi:phosphatase PAP2 family protein [Bacillus cihuensis]|uniref:phosphatase PAP2 family protein n=1 Tax=Bacillus cihuensis TaxID=1208599 RepID=UPI001F45A115|nr:phosphatase PAP2 family protein [Bacillus cihuensis]
MYEESIRGIFHELSPLNHSFTDQLFYSFPSEQALMALVIYGFVVFILVHTTRKFWIYTYVPIAGLVILFLTATSRLFLEVQLPSDVAAGYVFGGVWLGINILLLVILCLMRSVDNHSNRQLV